jgi:hypothetical protein
MPRHEECRKTNPCFPKDYEDIVGHIMTEANFFTPSERLECGAFRRFGTDFVPSPAFLCAS